MADPLKPRLSPATIALGAAAGLAILAAGFAVGRSFAPSPDPEAPAAAQGEAGSVEQAISTLEENVRREPDDARAWHLLGLARRDLGRFEAAAAAFRRAAELEPRDADHQAYLGEALLLAAEGAPTPTAAEQAFRRAIALAPGNPQARYYLATIRDMSGDHRGAIDDLLAILRDAPAGAPWEAQVREAVTTIASANRIDIAGRLPTPRAPATSGATAAIPGPTAAQLEAARSIPPGQQKAMVRGMVDGLAEKLRREPRDASRWIMLMRSRMVLGETEAARAALASALAAHRGDAAAEQRLRAAARELGVPG